MSCLGDVVAALVDGELEHAARERAQRHLAHCDDCRAEVDVQRRLKARLSGATTDPAPSDALTARLLSLRASDDTLPLTPAPPARPVSLRPATGPRTRRPGLRRRAAVGSAVVVLGVALALGGPKPSSPSTPVDPGTGAFVVDFVNSTSNAVGPGGAGTGR